MKINVTQDDIDCGTPQDSLCCPIALACLRIFGYEWVEVDGSTICTSKTLDADPSDDDKCFDLPEEAMTFITEFDKGNPVHPFEFEAKELEF